MSSTAEKTQPTRFSEALQDDDELVLFLQQLKKFEDWFVMMMTGQCDFNLRLEVRGNKGRMLQCRVDTQDTAIPRTAGKNRK